MNGLILESSPHGKDIKFIDKKDADIEANEAGEIFEKLLTSLVKEEKDSKNGNFLLGKLLGLSSDLEKSGKNVSDFSKDEILSDLKVKIDTKSNTSENEMLLQKESTIDEIVLEELYKIAFALKSEVKIDLDKTPKPIQNLLSNKKIINDLKSATNIKDLLNIAQKAGIKVKNFEFFKEDLALDPADKKLVQKVTSQDLFKLITPKESIKHQEHFKLPTHKASHKNILASLINKSTPAKEVIKESSDAKTVTKVALPSQTKTQTKTQTKAESKNNTNSIQTTDNTLESMEGELEAISKNRVSNKTTKTQTKESVASKPESNLVENSITKTVEKNRDKSEAKESSQTTEIIDETTIHKSESGDELKTQSTQKPKESHETKKSLNTFATEFKEKVESYKAPLMKIKMQLSPQNLGDVDVTLVNRGSTLHVNITSNTNSMALFMQNQAEFKNSLVNMGFSDLQMNFSENQSGQNQQNQKKDDNSNSKYSEFTNEEESDSVDIIIPNYI